MLLPSSYKGLLLMYTKHFAILRTKKIKSLTHIRLLDGHLRRLHPTPNADPLRKKYNRVLLGSPDSYAAYKELLTKHNITTLRKNGVLAIELLLAFSPQWLMNPDGTKSSQRLVDWIKTCTEWLKIKFGNKIITIMLHLDEQNPHIHAVIAPIKHKTNPKTGHTRASLCARDITGGREKLRKLQDSYAEAVAHLGLRRGVIGSKAKHTEVQDFYKFIAEGNRIAQKLQIEGPANNPELAAGWLEKLSLIENKLEEKGITGFFELMSTLKTHNSDFRAAENAPSIRPRW